MAKRLRKNHDGALAVRDVHTRTIDFEGGLKEGGEGAFCMFAESGAEIGRLPRARHGARAGPVGGRRARDAVLLVRFI